MKAKDLLAALQALSASELELPVYSMCDHGQQPEYSQMPSVIYFEYPHEPEGYTTDEEEAEENGYEHKAILL